MYFPTALLEQLKFSVFFLRYKCHFVLPTEGRILIRDGCGQMENMKFVTPKREGPEALGFSMLQDEFLAIPSTNFGIETSIHYGNLELT